jgi:Domain of unknown function (DUF4389)
VHPVRLTVSDDRRRSRLTVFFRLLLALPHVVWLAGWTLVAEVVAIANWIAVLITGETPPVLHEFLARYVRYATHVAAFLFLAANPFPGFVGRGGYPVDIEFAPPERQSRLAGAFRLLLAIPASILASLVGVFFFRVGLILLAAAGIWFAGLALGRAPRGLRDLSAWALGYSAQGSAYVLLVTGRYPDSHPDRLLGAQTVPYHPVRLRLEDDLRRSRLTTFFRLLLAFPHLFWLTAWGVLATLAAIVNWFAALIAGRSPRVLHRFLAAYIRYTSQVYAFLSVVAGPFPGFTGRAAGSPVTAIVDGPVSQRRLVTLFRLFLIVPALLLWAALGCVLLVVAIGGWCIGVLRGRMPSGLRALGASLIRYGAQVQAYSLVVTDRYPNSSPSLRTGPQP